jgi:nitroreductase
MDKPIAVTRVLEVINFRSSVRSYTGVPIDQPTVVALLEAAVRAPTARHEEPWQFLVIQDPGTLQRLSEQAKRLFTDEARRLHTPRGDSAAARFSQLDFDVFYGAGTLIVICAKMSGHFAIADCWLAAENLILAAQAMGLGTCVIGSAASALNTQAVKDELGIPARSTAVAPIIVGRPTGDWPPTERKEPEVLLWR